MAKVALIDICGVILPEAYIWYDEEATSLYRVKQQVQAAGEFDEIQLNICSPGGYCREGWSIVDYLYGLGKKINTLAYGQCASFGTVFHAMGEVRETTRFCEWMYHRPWDYTWGNDLQVAKWNLGLTKETQKLFGFYAERFAKPVEDVNALIQEDDLFLSPQECVDNGFSTGIYMAGPVAALASDKPGFNAPLDPAKRQKPVYMMSLGDRKINPDAPKDLPINTQNEMAKKPQSLAAAAQSILTVAQNGLGGLKALDVTLTDGRTMVTDSTGDAPVVGDTAKIDDADAPDGDYPSEKYGTITVASGQISTMSDDTTETTTSTDATAAADTETVTTEQDIVALKKENATLKAQVKAQESQLAEVTRRVNAVLGQMTSQEPITQANRVPSTSSAKNESEDPAETARAKMLAAHKAKFIKTPAAAATT